MDNRLIQVEFVRRQIVFQTVARFATWGSIRGDINNQTDLITLLNAKANLSAVYTKIQVDALLLDKADVVDVYTKIETDTLLTDQYNELLAISIALS